VHLESYPALLVLAVAVIAPLLAEIPIGIRLPALVLEIVLGIVIGPHVLGLATVSPLLGWLGGTLGLAGLFFMAGLELDLEKVRGQPVSLAARGWLVSLVLGTAAAAVLYALPMVHSPMMVALALTTTAMGVLMPVLRDTGEVDSGFGRLVVAAGAVGEFGPIVVMSLVLTRTYSSWVEIGLMLVFVAIAVGAALVALGMRPPKVVALLTRLMESSSQLPVRISLLLLAAFVVLSEKFGFEAVPGAFAAGMVVGLATRGREGKLLRAKIEAVCFGFLVPFFYVTTGMKFDLPALVQSTTTMLLLPTFLALLLVVRGTPVFLYRGLLKKEERLRFALLTATGLPLVVAVATLGVQSGRMRTDMAAALVGAAMLSVLLFPAIAGALRPKASRPGADARNSVTEQSPA
jgi:Kef-type K+ transport system membrane component KefB